MQLFPSPSRRCPVCTHHCTSNAAHSKSHCWVWGQERSRDGDHQINHLTFQKNPRAHKNKIGTPPPPKDPKYPPPKTRNFMEKMGFSCRKNAFFQASIKLTHPFPAPELRTRILRTRGFFWNLKGFDSGRVRPRQGTEICDFGAPSPLDFFFYFFQWIFLLFSRFTVQLSEEIDPKCGENCPISGRRKKRRILSRLWLWWFSSVPIDKPCIRQQ